MSQSSGTITSVFKSRQNLLKLLFEQGYDIKDYEEFSVNETHAMYNNKQLDMMMSSKNKEVKEKKVYVKYHLGKTYKAEGCFFLNGKWRQDTFFFDDEFKNFMFKD